MELNLYEFAVDGPRKYSNKYLIKSDNPYNALTKLRIVHGESVYRKCYGVYKVCQESMEEFTIERINELFSYGMLKEQIKRDYGRNYYYNQRTWR